MNGIFDFVNELLNASLDFQSQLLFSVSKKRFGKCQTIAICGQIW
jgi:hypothetical protein